MLSSLPLFPVTRARPGADKDAGTTERARKDGRVSEPITMGELFCGPGGVAVGAGEAARELGMPLKHVWANDIDPDTCQTYRTNIERMYGDEVLCKNEDVRGLDMSELPDVKGLAFGFPCNDFGAQEPGTEEQIKTFCSTTYGVSFPMFSKIHVKGPEQAPLYAYLTREATSPDGPGDIGWNFAKFIIGKDGRIVARLSPTADPTGSDVRSRIEAALAE